MRKTMCVDVEIDVDLNDFTVEQLRDELAKRDMPSGVPPLNTEEHHPLHEIYYAFKFGLDQKAAELARAYICDELGVVL